MGVVAITARLKHQRCKRVPETHTTGCGTDANVGGFIEVQGLLILLCSEVKLVIDDLIRLLRTVLSVLVFGPERHLEIL